MTSFMIQLQKLVILDFLIRNTDRGLDNFMIGVSCSPPPGPATPPNGTTRAPPSPQPPMSSAALPGGAAKSDNSTMRPHLHLAAIG